MLPDGLPAALTPFAFLVGKWRGTGVISYARVPGEAPTDHEFSQTIEFWHDGQPYLNYRSEARLIDESGTALPNEVGYWRIARPAADTDAGPGLLPASGEPVINSPEDLERLRNAAGGFDIEVSILHPSGISELYLGWQQGARIDLATDAVLRPATSKDYTAARRMYGQVEGHLLWAWDIAALGNPMASHASARLERVS